VNWKREPRKRKARALGLISVQGGQATCARHHVQPLGERDISGPRPESEWKCKERGSPEQLSQQALAVVHGNIQEARKQP